MASQASSYYELVTRCETAIVRIRAALRAGDTSSEAVGADWELVRECVTPRLIVWAHRASWLAPEAEDEALVAMIDRLFDDIWSLTFVSLETQFGAYLRSMPVRVLRNLRRRYVPPGRSLPTQRLDTVSDGAGLSRQEHLDSLTAPDLFGQVGAYEALDHAIAQLLPEERDAVMLRRQEIENNEIARRLGVSPATASRIYRRALENLRRSLDHGEA